MQTGSHRRYAAVVLTVAAMALLLSTDTSVAAAPTQNRVHWQVRGVFPSVRVSVGKVVCPTASVCVTLPAPNQPSTPLHPEILRSTDRGAHWRRASITATPPLQLRDVACATSKLCVALGETLAHSTVYFLRSTDDGATWIGRSTSVDAALSGTAVVSCWDARHCVALASRTGATLGFRASAAVPSPSELVTSNAGATWTTSGGFGLRGARPGGLDCPAPLTCEAVGSYRSGEWSARTVNGGTSWNVHPLPRTSEDPTGLSCGTQSFCVAIAGMGVDSVVYRTVDAGATWTARHLGARHALPQAVDCRASGVCVIGGSWSPSLVATEGLLEESDDEGATWTRRSLPASSGALGGVECLTDATCVLLGTAVGEIDEAAGVPQVLRLAGGRIAPGSTPIDRWFDPRGVACATANRCIVVGGTASASGELASVKTTRDAGRTWRSVEPISSVSGLRSVACTSASHCLAVGWEETRTLNGVILATTDAGHSWRVVERVPSADTALADVACLSRSECLAVGAPGAIFRSADGGARWARVALPRRLELTSLACPTRTTCVAEGRDLESFAGVAYASRNGGRKWRAATYTWLPGPQSKSAPYMRGIACATPNRCVAVTSAPIGGFTWVEVSRNGGASWTHVRSPRRVRALTSVSCPAPATCVAIGATTHADVLTSVDAGRAWRLGSAPPGVSTLSGVWCERAGCWVSGTRSGGAATELARIRY